MQRLLTAAAIAALLAVVAAEAYRWLLGGSHLGLLAVVFLACLASGLATLRIVQRPGARGARSRGTRSRDTRRARSRAPRPKARPAADGPRETGTVKWFSRSKGFGFVIREDGDEIFVHHRSIRSDGDRRGNLRDGQRVTFVAVERSKGWQAEDVSPEGD